MALEDHSRDTPLTSVGHPSVHVDGKSPMLPLGRSHVRGTARGATRVLRPVDVVGTNPHTESFCGCVVCHL